MYRVIMNGTKYRYAYCLYVYYTQYTRNIIFKPQRKTYIIIENKKSICNAREHKINIEVDDRVYNIGIKYIILYFFLRWKNKGKCNLELNTEHKKNHVWPTAEETI